jgi:hypothetical protein
MKPRSFTLSILFLQRLEAGHAVAVAIEVPVGEQPTFERSGRALEEIGGDLRRLVVVRRVEILAQRDDAMLQQIDERGAVLVDERLARGPERQRDLTETAARIEQNLRHNILCFEPALPATHCDQGRRQPGRSARFPAPVVLK